MFYDQALSFLGCRERQYRGITVDITLSSPTSVQLYELVGLAPTIQWESLHIILNEPDVDPSVVETIFTGANFSNLKTLRVEEKRDETAFGQDPYGSLYDAIFLTATKLQNLYVDSDLKALAQQYGLFGQHVTSIGGSTCFVANAIPINPDTDAYSAITRLSLYRWDVDTVKDLTLPNLRFLKVDHCLHDVATQVQPSVILPSLLWVHLTVHSLPVLSQLCAGGLESLTVDSDEGDWHTTLDGCLSPGPIRGSIRLYTFDLDVWSTPCLERVAIYAPISGQHLLTFLHNAKGLKELTLVVPNDREWCGAFAGAMGARWGYSGHLAHCPQLETLTLLMNWDYTEGEWLEEIRTIFDARESTMKSVICRWKGDARQPESGPAGNFDIFQGEYYGGAGESEMVGPNVPSESKQVEAYAKEESMEEDAEEEEEDSEHSEELDLDEDEDDVFGYYDDIPFP